MDSILRLRRPRHIGRTERAEAIDPLLCCGDPLPRCGAPRRGPLTRRALALRGVSADGSLRVALAGYGLAGRVFHAALIAATEGLELSAVVTNDAARREELAAEHPQARAVGALSEALDAADLVVIASPNRFHVPLAREAIAAGKSVVVDKPLAVTAAEAHALDDEARAAGVVLSAFHNRRWDDDFLTLQREVAAGTLGDVITFESRFDRWRPQIKRGAWRELADPADGGGLLLDLGSHLVDQAIQLLGAPTQVYAELRTTRPDARVEDEVFLALDHTGGARSHLHAGVHAADGPPRFRVLGSRAAFVARGLDPQEAQLRAGMRPGDAAAGYGRRAPEDAATVHADGDPRRLTMEPGAWTAFYAGVRDAIRDPARTTPPPVTAAQAVAVLDVLEAARDSARNGTVVALG